MKNYVKYVKNKLFENPLIVYLETEKYKAVKIGLILKRELGIKIRLVDRRRKEILCRKNFCSRYSSVITVGGDGTFLRTAQIITNVPLLGINSNPDEKEGFLAGLTINNFEKKINSIIKGNFKIDELPLIKVKVNNKEINEKAVNEVFIGSKKSYRTSEYKLLVNGKKELQLSSGIIVSTSEGTNAWFKSAGGKSMKNKNNLYFIVREPYSGRIYKPRIISGSIRKGDCVIIEPLTPMVLVFDSLSKEYKIKKGDKVSIKLGKEKLKRVLF